MTVFLSARSRRIARAVVLVAIAGSAAACGAEFRAGSHPSPVKDAGTDAGAAEPKDGGFVVVPPPDASFEDGAATDGGRTFTVIGHAVVAPQLPNPREAPIYSPPPLAFSSAPIVNRQIALLDASGVLTKVTTDTKGAFSVTGVTAPYDLAILPPAANPQSPPVVYASLSAPHLFVGGLADDAPPVPVSAETTFFVQIGTPASCTPCDMAIGMTGVGGSLPIFGFAGNGNLQTISAGPDGGSPLVELVYAWTGSEPTGVSVDALIGPTDGGEYFYANGTQALPPDGGAATMTSLVTVPVGTAGVATVSANPPIGGPGTYQPDQIAATINFASGNSLPLNPVVGDASASPSFVVPDINGATLSLVAYAGGYLIQSFASSGALALTASSAELQPYGAPAMTFPASLTTTAGQITWVPTLDKEIFVADLVDISGASPLTACEVITSSGAVDFARLSALGVSILPTVSVVALYGYGQIESLDALVDGDGPTLPDGTQECNERQNFRFGQ